MIVSKTTRVTNKIVNHTNAQQYRFVMESYLARMNDANAYSRLFTISTP